MASNEEPVNVGDEQDKGADLNDLVELEIVREVDAEGNPVETTGDDNGGNGEEKTMDEQRLADGAGQAEVAEPDFAAAAAAAEVPDPVETVTEERDRLREDLLRAQADFINFRKRMEREKNEVILRASQSLIEELLPVIDNLELALANNQQQADPDTYGEGVRLIHKQLVDLLGRHGLSEISCVGETFDPNIHEAVAVIRDPEKENNTVVAELKKGYFLRDRLIRSPLVQVVINEEDEPESPAPSAD